MKRSNVRGAKGPCHLQGLHRKEGRDEMIKASIDLQDLKRRIYVKAKAEPSWRFWQFQKRRGLGRERWSRPRL
jgi:RNA-directed DNA polymerase